MLGIFLPQLFEDASGLKLIGQRRVGGVGIAHRQHRQRIKGLRFKIVGISIVKFAHCFFIRDHAIARPDWPMTRLPDLARRGTVRRAVVGIQRCDKLPLTIGAGLHRHRLVRCCLAGAHFVGSRRRPDRMPPRHGDSPLRHGTRRILGGDVGENPARLFIKKRVQQRHAASEFRLHSRRARHRKIHRPGCAQIARFRDSRGRGAEGCETADDHDEESRAAQECSNTHVNQCPSVSIVLYLFSALFH